MKGTDRPGPPRRQVARPSPVSCLTPARRLGNLSAMTPLVRRLEESIREEFLTPTLARFDELERRLDGLERRLTEVQDLLQVVLARAEASSERSLAVMESTARNARRLEELEQALGAR
jgi:hypothetical protein